MNPATNPELDTDVQLLPDGKARVILRGRLERHNIAACWHQLEQNLRGNKVMVLEVDATGLEACDSAGIALLHYLHMQKMTPQAKVSVQGLDAKFDATFRELTLADWETFLPATGPHRHSIPLEIGATVGHMADDLRELVTFQGAVTAELPAVLRSRKLMRWPEVFRIFEQAGANAVPIVSLVSLLVGLIIAFESARPLAQFGAQLYVANMIGLIMVRELGPLLAALIFAGRSGSAFAAEIGTMKVNEELNALETLGLDPLRFLVVQRITAGILLTPLLAIYATFLGVLGGVAVTMGLGFPLSLIAHQLVTTIHLHDIFLALAKGVVFGAIVSAVGCLRGLQTQQGPSAVGISTTRAVVSSILLIVIADAIFSVLFFSLVK